MKHSPELARRVGEGSSRGLPELSRDAEPDLEIQGKLFEEEKMQVQS